MKKRILGVFLALCLIICAAPILRAQAASDVIFVSVNDRLLEVSSKAELIGGDVLVPCSIFSNFRVNYSYFSNSSTAMLYTTDKQLYFDIANGTTYDAQNHSYAVTATYLNGMTYVPVGFVCSQFGLSFSYIEGTTYGDVCRITDSSAVLTDSQFFEAASGQMQTKYNAYKSATSPGSGVTQGGVGTGTKVINLSFRGLPTEVIFTCLTNWQADATFFLSAEDIRSEPDTVRRLVGGGHEIGIVCEDFEEYERASSLLYEAAHMKTVLVSDDGDGAKAKALAEERELVFCGYNIDGVQNGRGMTSAAGITGRLTAGDNYVRLLCNDATEGNLAYLLKYMADNDCIVRPVTEIWHG